MATLHVPHGVADLDRAWLTAALAGMSGGVNVLDARTEAIGNGMVSDSVRVHLRWERPAGLPATVVAKVASSQARSREAAAITRTYLLEAGWYNELASTVDVRCPACHAARYDPVTGDYVVVLEDVAPAEAGDQLAGCGVDQAAGALAEMVALHSPRWGDPSIERLDWLERPTAETAAGTAELLALLWPGFVERYGAAVVPEVLDLTEQLLPHLPRLLAQVPRPWTLLHGDFRLDNLLFGGPRVVVVDWQTIRMGAAANDLAYFLGSGLTTEDRRAAEWDLVDEYHSRLVARGVDWSAEACRAGYRTGGLGGLLVGFGAAMLVAPTDRGDLMFTTMVNRHGLQLLDHGADTELTKP